MKLMLVMALAAALVGCTGQTPGDAPGAAATPTPDPIGTIDESCRQAAESAAMDPMQDSAERLDEAIRACTTFEDLEQVLDQVPVTLDGVDPEEFVRDRCQQEPALADTAICEELTN